MTTPRPLAKPAEPIATEVLVSASRRAVIYLRVSTNAQAETDLDSEGLSIKAQRQECRAKAQTLDAVVVEEYIDIGESARSSDREQLQRMLERLSTRQDVDYVIVHKIDRLARNRLDDVSITMAIQKSGARLVSCSENIDETPQGRFMHAIMAGVAELYSANLATEALKGMRQKAKMGGTPGTAPIGYLNVIKPIDGHNVRTIEVDQERSPHVCWAFEAYATGEWSLSRLSDELAERGMRFRPLGKGRGNKPLSRSQVHRMLRNPYYVGIVTFEGVQFAGRHEALISLELFDQVQRVLDEKRLAGERPIRHTHYLKGTLFCGLCGSRLGISHNKGNGGTYGYFYCLNRQRTRRCQLPWIPMDTAESLIQDYWLQIRPSEEKRARTRQQIVHHIGVVQQLSQKELGRQQQRLVRLDSEERKLLQAHYAEAVSLELLQSEQRRIATERQQAKNLLSVSQLQFDGLEAEVDDVLGTLNDGHALYLSFGPRQRRTMNRSVFERLWITELTVVASNLMPGFAHVAQERLDERLTEEEAIIRTSGLTDSSNNHADPSRTYTRASHDEQVLMTDDELETWLARELDFAPIERPFGLLAPEATNPSVFQRQGSNDVLLVRPPGLEPGTCRLRV